MIQILMVMLRLLVMVVMKIDENTIDGDGDDRTFRGAGGDKTIDGAGDDKTFGGVGDDKTIDGNGDDKDIGGVGDDNQFGGFGDDKTIAGDGDDIIITILKTIIGGVCDTGEERHR